MRDMVSTRDLSATHWRSALRWNLTRWLHANTSALKRTCRFLPCFPAVDWVMIAADAVLLASGTAALEALLAKRPMVVAYRLSNLTYRIVKSLGLMKVDHYSLPNFLSESPIVPELMQDDCRPDALAAALLPTLRERRIDPALLAEYQRIHQFLIGDADHDATAAVAELIESRRQ